MTDRVGAGQSMPYDVYDARLLEEGRGGQITAPLLGGARARTSNAARQYGTSLPLHTKATQEEAKKLPRPRYTSEQLHLMFEKKLSKETYKPIAKVALLGAASVALLPLSQDLLAAVTVSKPGRWLVSKIVTQSQTVSPETYVGLFAALLEIDRRVLGDRAISKQIVKGMYKTVRKASGNAIKWVFAGEWQLTLPQRAELMAKKMREESQPVEEKFKDHASLKILDDDIDEYVASGSADKVAPFSTFFDWLKTREFLIRAPLPFEVKPIPMEHFVKVQKEIDKTVPKEVAGRVAAFNQAWCKSTLMQDKFKGKPFMAVIGDSYLPKVGCDLPLYLCEKFGKTPVTLSMNEMLEFIDVSLPKDVRSRMKYKTTAPAELLGPFMDWIKSGDAACPIVIHGVDFKNADHARIIALLKNPKTTEIAIHYGEKGVVFRKNIERTPFILCADEAAESEKMRTEVPHAIIDQSSDARRRDALERAYDICIDGLKEPEYFPALGAAKKKAEIESLLKQEKYKTMILEEGKNLDLTGLMDVVGEVFGDISFDYALKAVDRPPPSATARIAPFDLEAAIKKRVEEHSGAAAADDKKEGGDDKDKVADKPEDNLNDAEADVRRTVDIGVQVTLNAEEDDEGASELHRLLSARYPNINWAEVERDYPLKKPSPTPNLIDMDGA
jgi:hypothetical protein